MIFSRPLIAKVVGVDPLVTVHFSLILAWLKLNWSIEGCPSLLHGIEKVDEGHAISAWIGDRSDGGFILATVRSGEFVGRIEKLSMCLKAMDPSMKEYKVFESIANRFFSGTRVLCELSFGIR
ncbi:unnamed protein product [Angiostrongylus costaricensis]|uniref:DUF4283 domain-containing protein n=1 Tax=Angiostrongylus costaricensis TaxID=334426 RepID=A0A0R3PX03_ANGCS|nr:unnamed protein product [Angiostrongylus costaricensis]